MGGAAEMGVGRLGRRNWGGGGDSTEMGRGARNWGRKGAELEVIPRAPKCGMAERRKERTPTKRYWINIFSIHVGLHCGEE